MPFTERCEMRLVFNKLGWVAALVFANWTAGGLLAQAEAEPVAIAAPELAALPFEITSFGAARVGETLYVYGGHTGNAHSYSNQEQSNELLALDLSNPGSWKKVSNAGRLQGLAMVAHESKVILLGGFTAKNDLGLKD